ncbi:MAG TPA: serine/threonine-protein kinase [Polyangiaceae bacterium]|nr:serine/threonine-protein kinase [Polyangiaceae bacterium]
MAESAVSAGHVLLGRYRLEVQLGAGGMGTIWRAQHLVLNAPVAVKVIDRTAVPDEETLARFMREAQSAAALRSPHVVQILDYGIDGKVPFMAMELLEGENLAQRIKRKKRLSPQETARVLSHIGRAIARAHEAGIVHRDLKPENVFLVKNEDEEIAKVLDFGVAKVESHALSEGTRTRTGSILGTPFYMSPEQAQGNRTVDSRSDLWSMGVIAFECLTGKRPFYSDGLGDLVLAICVRDIPVPSEVAAVPIGFDAWWHRAVARDPEKRFQTAKELTESLREALGLESRDPAREAPHAAPDIEVTSAPDTARDTPPTDPVPGMHASGVVTSGAVTIKADDVALPNAATIQAPLPGDVPALTERQFSTTQKSPPSAPQPSSDGTGVVIGVAAAALFIGLIGGVLWLRSQRQDSADQQRALPPPLPVAVHQPSEPKVKPKAAPSTSAAASPSASAAKPLLEFLPGEPTSGAGPAVAATPAPEPRAAAAAAKPEAAPPAATPAPPAPAGSGTGGAWVKPAWAIPDEEPVRRAPIDE